MKPNGLNNIEDFIINDLFIEWVLAPNEENITLWATYLADFPEKIQLVEEAKTLVLQIHEVESITAPKAEIEKNWTIIQQQIIQEKPKNVAKVRTLSWWKYAATIASLFMIGFFSFYFLQNSTKSSDKLSNKTTPKCEWKELINTTAVATTLALSDGSKVILEPFSSLKYPTCFVKNQREVVLKGEAFFDIHRDTMKK